MQGSSHERRGHFRGKVRLGRALPVRIAANPFGLPVAKAVAASWRDAQTLDIGVGGAFIIDADLLIGAHLWVELQLPNTEQRFVLPAVVRWVGDRVYFASDGAVPSAPHSTGQASATGMAPATNMSPATDMSPAFKQPQVASHDFSSVLPQPFRVGHVDGPARNLSLVRGGGVQFVEVEVDVLLELNDYFEAL